MGRFTLIQFAKKKRSESFILTKMNCETFHCRCDYFSLVATFSPKNLKDLKILILSVGSLITYYPVSTEARRSALLYLLTVKEDCFVEKCVLMTQRPIWRGWSLINWQGRFSEGFSEPTPTREMSRSGTTRKSESDALDQHLMVPRLMNNKSKSDSNLLATCSRWTTLRLY